MIWDKYVGHSQLLYFEDNAREAARVLTPPFFIPKGASLSEKIGTEVFSLYVSASGITHDVYGGDSYTIIGEAYWNCGLRGIVICCAWLGYLVWVVEQGALGLQASDVHVIVYTTIASAAIQILETAQLGVNAVASYFLLNFEILSCLCARFTRSTHGDIADTMGGA